MLSLTPRWQRTAQSLCAATALLLLAASSSFAGNSNFVRGDANGDGDINIADTVQILSFLTMGTDITCLDAADVNDSGEVNVADAVHTLHVFFQPGTPLTIGAPSTCGPDPTADALGCESFSTCP